MNDDNKTADSTAPIAPQTDGIENAPTSEPELKFTQRQLDEHFNKMFTGRIGRLEKTFRKQLDEAVATMRGQPKPTADPDDAAKTAALAAFEAIENERKAQLAAAEDRERELLARELRSEAENTLARLGCINPRAARLVLAEDGRISRNANGDLIFDDGSEEGVAIEAGLRAWLNTDEGKNYRAARGGGEGSGTVIRGGAPRTGGTLSKEEAKRAAMHTLNAFILGSRR